MMARGFIVLAALALAACQTDAPDTRPQVTVGGPVFPASRFDCGRRPVPPDPVLVGAAAASAAARYEADLKYWGQHCSNQLQAVGSELKAAGQVVDAPRPAGK